MTDSEKLGRALCARLGVNPDKTTQFPPDPLDMAPAARSGPRWQLAAELALRQAEIAKTLQAEGW